MMPMTDSRIFQEINKESGDLEWFFESREGFMGSYESEELASLAVARHLERCCRDHLDGGRHFSESRQRSPQSGTLMQSG